MVHGMLQDRECYSSVLPEQAIGAPQACCLNTRPPSVSPYKSNTTNRKTRMYYPSIVFAALFSGLIFADILNQQTNRIPGHAFFGLVLIIITVVLTQNNADLVAWGLLILPLTILFISFIMVVLRGPWGTTSSKRAPTAVRAAVSTGGSPMQLSCTVQSPSSTSTIVPTPLAQPSGVVQGTIASTSTQPAALANLSQPLSAYVSKPPTTQGALTPVTACAT